MVFPHTGVRSNTDESFPFMGWHKWHNSRCVIPKLSLQTGYSGLYFLTWAALRNQMFVAVVFQSIFFFTTVSCVIPRLYFINSPMDTLLESSTCVPARGRGFQLSSLESPSAHRKIRSTHFCCCLLGTGAPAEKPVGYLQLQLRRLELGH